MIAETLKFFGQWSHINTNRCVIRILYWVEDEICYLGVRFFFLLVFILLKATYRIYVFFYDGQCANLFLVTLMILAELGLSVPR